MNRPSGPPAKRNATCIIGGIALTGTLVLGLFIWYAYLDISYIRMEQKAWHPKDMDRVWCNGQSYSRRGMVLDVYAPAGVAEVWEPKGGAIWQSWSWPWEPHHYRVPFRLIEGEDDEHVKIIVDYKFSPREEWLLAIKSKDGYWVSMSPYFPSKPDLTEAEWDQLVAASQLVLPDE